MNYSTFYLHDTIISVTNLSELAHCVCALTHNKSYRSGSSCVKISVTEGGKGDTTQHFRIYTGTPKQIFSVIKRREGQNVG